MKNICLAIALLIVGNVYAQNKGDYTAIADQIRDEGFKLYRLETASWLGTDMMLESIDEEERSNIGGYFSYQDKGNFKCLFFSRDEEPKVVYTATFNDKFESAETKEWQGEREFTALEKEVYELRKAAIKLLSSDEFFEQYKNTNFNIIPIVENGKNEVYVLTATQQSGVVLFGNDYHIVFDNNLKVKEKKKLHQNIIQIKIDKSLKGQVAIHNHIDNTSGYITATDVCTILLYQEIAGWEQCIVMSKKFVSIWDCKENKLGIITTKAFKKIYKDVKARN